MENEILRNDNEYYYSKGVLNRIERCQAKAQSVYTKNEFPCSLRAVYIIRCSIVHENQHALMNGITAVSSNDKNGGGSSTFNLTLFDKMFRIKTIDIEYGGCDAIGRRDSTISEGNMDIIRDNLPLVLKSWDLIPFVIAGIAGKFAGAGLFLSFIIGGSNISGIFSGLCYCEFATRIPISGSAYTYTYCSFGESIGWNLTLEYGKWYTWYIICCNKFMCWCINCIDGNGTIK